MSEKREPFALDIPWFWLLLALGIGSQFLALIHLDAQSVTAAEKIGRAMTMFVFDPYCFWNLVFFLAALFFSADEEEKVR
ncbi:MAG: hypothetical protein IJG85_00175 [Eubacteriaceae bacterium]|nr:hypothetical protein [Eubacteriaceae bacterium]